MKTPSISGADPAENGDHLPQCERVDQQHKNRGYKIPFIIQLRKLPISESFRFFGPHRGIPSFESR